MPWPRPHGAGLAATSRAIGPRHRSGAASPRSAGAASVTGVTPMAYPEVTRCAVVTDLVACAGNGEKQAWDALVERYSPLIWSICRRHRLGDADARGRPEHLAAALAPAR